MLSKTVYPQLDTIRYNKVRPLIICDADEVIFNFMDEFINFLGKEELIFSWESYALSGNIIDKKGKQISDKVIKYLIKKFFSECTCNMKLIKGVKKSLIQLSNYFNILILSNIPFQHYGKRKLALKENKLDFPFIANIGEKGNTCFAILKMFKQKTWFIDDSPFQIYSVKKINPTISTILFVANKKLAKLIDKEKCWDYYSNSWKENKNILTN